MRPLALPGVAFDALPGTFKAHRPELSGHGIEFKGLQTGELKTDRAKRRVELWIAGYGNVDLGGDLALKGASAQTIAEDMPRGLVKFFANHQEPLGTVELLEEHEQGLLMVGKVTAHADLDKTLAQIEDGTYGHGSLGYSVRDFELLSAAKARSTYGVDTGRFPTVRVIKNWRVWEGSAVIWPMNELATVVGVKGGAMQRKDLWDLANVIEALARIRYLTSSEWAAIDEDEAAEARRLLELMTDAEKAIRAGLETKNGQPPASPASRAAGLELGGFAGVLAAANRRAEALKTLTL